MRLTRREEEGIACPTAVRSIGQATGPATFGAQKGLRGATVLVDEAIEHVDAPHIVGRTNRRRQHRNRRLQIDTAMRPSVWGARSRFRGFRRRMELTAEGSAPCVGR